MQALGHELRLGAGPGAVRRTWLRRVGAAFLSGLVLASVAAPSAFAAKSGGTISTSPVTGKFAVAPATVVVGAVTPLRFAFSGTTSGARTIRIALPSSFSAPQTTPAFSPDDLTGIGWVSAGTGCVSVTSGDAAVINNTKLSPRVIQFTLSCTRDLSTGSLDYVARASATGSQKFPVYVAPSTTAFATLAVNAANGKVAITAADTTAGVTTQISAKVVDTKGVGVAGVPVRFADSLAAAFAGPQIPCPDNTSGGVACTDANGVARIGFTSTLAGSHRLSATILGTNTGTQKAVAVVAGPVAVVAIAGDPADLVAGDPKTVTVSAVDGYANTVSLASGHDVALAQGASDGGTVSGLDASVANVTARDFTVVGEGVGSISLTAIVDGVASDPEAPVAFDVVAGAVASIAFDDASVSLTSGDAATTVTIHGVDAGGNPVDISTAVATLSQSGTGTLLAGDPAATLDGGLSIDLTGVTEGTGVLTATIDGTSATIAFSVVPGALNAIAIDGSTADLAAGVVRTFTVHGYDAAGNGVDLSNENVALTSVGTAPVWISDATAVGGGFAFDVTGGTAGDASIEATLGTFSATADFAVVPGAPILTLVVPAGDLTSGASWTVTIGAADAAGNVIDLSAATVSLTADPGGVGTVSIVADEAAGPIRSFTVTGLTEGTVVLAAAFGDATAGATFSVIPGTLDAISLVASSSTVQVDGILTFTVSGVDAHGNPVTLDVADITFGQGGDGTLTLGEPAQAGRLVVMDATAATTGAVLVTVTSTASGLSATTPVTVEAAVAPDFQIQSTRVAVSPAPVAPAPVAPARPTLPAKAASAASAVLSAVFPVTRPSSVVRGR